MEITSCTVITSSDVVVATGSSQMSDSLPVGSLETECSYMKAFSLYIYIFEMSIGMFDLISGTS